MTTATVLMLVAIIWFVIIPSMQPRTIPVKKLIILPAIFIYLLYNSIDKNFKLFPESYLIIGIGVAMGIIIGYLVRRNVSINVDREKEQIHLPGSYMSLILFSLIFSAHFVVGWLSTQFPGYFQNLGDIQMLLLLLVTAFSSLTIGLNGTLYFKYLHSLNSNNVEVRSTSYK